MNKILLNDVWNILINNEVPCSDFVKKTMADLENVLMFEKKCSWKYDDDGFYHTKCNHDYSLIDGTLIENSHAYCPKCGGKIVII